MGMGILTIVPIPSSVRRRPHAEHPSYLEARGPLPGRGAIRMTQSDSRRNAVALAAVCLTSLMFGLEISSVPVILPTLEHAAWRFQRYAGS